jgi:hypothetical protein
LTCIRARLDALARDAGADHLGEPVDVDARDAEARVDLCAHLLRPRLGAAHRKAQADLAGLDAPLGERLRERERVARGARDQVRPEVLDQHQLALGQAAGHRDDRQPEPFTARMQAEAAGEEPVAVGVVQRRARLGAGHREAAGIHAREEVDVRGGVAHDGQLPRRAGGSVEPTDLVARDGEHPEGVRVAEVVLARERECLQFVDRADVSRLGVGETLTVERDSLLGVLDERPQPGGLQRPQPLARKCLSFRLVDHGRIFAL